MFKLFRFYCTYFVRRLSGFGVDYMFPVEAVTKVLSKISETEAPIAPNKFLACVFCCVALGGVVYMQTTPRRVHFGMVFYSEYGGVVSDPLLR